MASAQVGIIMGSDSDWPKVREAAAVLDEFGVRWEATVSSAHRTPDRTAEWARTAAGRGLKVVIAAAGLAAHLPGVVAAHTTLPVIGLPISAGALSGLDALYSIVQMPPGVPVATVGIDAARNAGLLAVQVLAAGQAELADKLAAYKESLAAAAVARDEKLQSELAGRND